MNRAKTSKTRATKRTNRSRTPRAPNSLVTAPVVATRKQTGATGSGRRYVGHELVGNLLGSNAIDHVVTLDVNPGLEETFPLSFQTANRFVKYRVLKLNLCYETATGTSTPGTVRLAVTSDVDGPPATTDAEMGLVATSVSDSPWKTICLRVPPSVLEPNKWRLVRSQGTSLSLTGYDPCVLTAGIFDSPTDAVLGKLYLDFEFEFTELHPPTTTVRSPREYVFARLTNNTTLDNGTTQALAFTDEYDQMDNMTVDHGGLGIGSTYQLPTGVYEVLMSVHASHLGTDTGTLTIAVRNNGVSFDPVIERASARSGSLGEAHILTVQGVIAIQADSPSAVTFVANTTTPSNALLSSSNTYIIIKRIN